MNTTYAIICRECLAYCEEWVTEDSEWVTREQVCTSCHQVIAWTKIEKRSVSREVWTAL